MASHDLLIGKNLERLQALRNPKVLRIVEEYISLCKPAKVTVLTDAKEDIQYMRDCALRDGEESHLNLKGHTIHFDGAKDQARDKENTRVLLSKGTKVSSFINAKDRDDGLKEVLGFLDGSMQGKELLVCFFCLGPNNSRFSIPSLQLTDSAYVAHSESILYRPGYDEFKRLEGSEDFFYFIHSAGELDERQNSRNIDKRRVYIDLEENRVFTVNNQYAGNSVGLKKLALRLAINKANQEDWLCEHMFIMGAHGLDGKRVTYFTGAYPSACGKTSTAMLPSHTIIGDDIAYLKIASDGKTYAVNVEQGIFGIIADVNPEDDPIIYHTLTTPRELIFSNVLIVDGVPYWLNMGKPMPKEGIAFCGNWNEGMKDSKGKAVQPTTANARYTIKISELKNADPQADNPQGVPIGGFIYGGRDSDTTIPVFESLSWAHGVYVGAVVESETTAAAIGQVGVRSHNPMANLDFLVVPLGLYIKNHLAFGDRLDHQPKIFHTNYFLKDDGKFLNSKMDKQVWLLWMEGRVHNEFGALETPIGFIPKYEDLKILFADAMKKDYARQDYEQQFSIRISKLLEKIARMEKIFAFEEGLPDVFTSHLQQEKARIEDAGKKFGKGVVSPFEFYG